MRLSITHQRDFYPHNASFMLPLLLLLLHAFLLGCVAVFGAIDGLEPRKEHLITLDNGNTFHVQIREEHTPVVSTEYKFIIPVPKMPGNPFLIPEGAQKGEPIKDWQGNVVQGNGFVFMNGKDQSWQAVRTDGHGVIIMNSVGPEVAQKLQPHVPEKMSLDSLQGFLHHAENHFGIVDRYNSDQDYVRKNLNPVSGFLHRRNGQRCNAGYVSGAGHFQGPAASPQQFSRGAVIVKCGNQEPRLVQPEIFEQSYTNPDGTKINLSKLDRLAPENKKFGWRDRARDFWNRRRPGWLGGRRHQSADKQKQLELLAKEQPKKPGKGLSGRMGALGRGLRNSMASWGRAIGNRAGRLMNRFWGGGGRRVGAVDKKRQIKQS